MSGKFILLGRLRRDLMLLGHSESSSDLADQAEKAVKEGRAAETFVLAVSSYFSEADHNWDPEGTMAGAKPSDVPPLNPDNGEQQSLATSDRPFTTPRLEIEKAVKEQLDSGEMVDTRQNPDATPTGSARSQAELDAGKPSGGQVKSSPRDDAPTGAGTVRTDAKPK